MNVLDLFSGIGGFSLGLERAGFKTVAFCEVDKNCHKVLKKNWPDVPIFTDVKTLKGSDINEPIDVICGGFPCQDISFAGKGAGLEGERSGLWWEFHRLIKEIKPKWVIAENVSALRSRGLDKVLSSLNEVGYDAEWHCIPASSVGAPHQRDRIWILAYPNNSRSRTPECNFDSDREKIEQERNNKSFIGISGCGEDISNSNEFGTQIQIAGEYSSEQVLRGSSETWRARVGEFWSIEPSVGRVANGVSNRSHRIKQLGNAVVPQIPQLIGECINETYKQI
jgi:DNA (cytosine-5)-methyltransferase 1